MKRQVIGWIGIGKMGLPMAAHLCEAGYSVQVFDTNKKNIDRVIEYGAIQTDSIAQLCQKSELVFSMIPDDRVIHSLGQELAKHLCSDAIYIDMSTVSPEASARVAQILASVNRNIEYVRAPVSGSTATAKNASLAVMLSGKEIACNSIKPVLDVFSSKVFYLGSSEEARYVKLALNLLVGASSSLLAETLAFARKGGVDTKKMMDVISSSVVASPLFAYKYDNIVNDSYAPAFTVGQIMKDLDLLLQTGRNNHVAMPLISLVRQQYEEAYLSGCNQEDFFVLCRQQQQKV